MLCPFCQQRVDHFEPAATGSSGLRCPACGEEGVPRLYPGDYLNHPAVPVCIFGPTGHGKSVYIDALLHTLREAGFTPEQAYHAYHAIDGHTVGFTMWELGHTAPWTDAAVETAMQLVGSGEFPYLLEHGEQHELDHDVSGFEFGLDLVFDGLRDLLGMS